jgi:hypothetical protein
MGKEDGAVLFVIKLTPIVTLNCGNGCVKMCGDKGGEKHKYIRNIGFGFKRVGPHKVSKVINKNEIEFKP